MKDSNNRRITRDNRHVAKYNPYMFKKFEREINVECWKYRYGKVSI